jgi:hypothetical protein
MDNDTTVEEETLDTPEAEASKEETEEVEQDNSEELASLRKKAEVADNYKIRAEKAEAERKALEKRLNSLSKNGEKPSLDVEDYIDISASLEGLDQREKEKLAQEHRLTGKPLAEIRKNEDFTLWQSAYREKVEKERALTPSSAQGDAEKPQSLQDKLRTASLDEKEKLLAAAGLYKSPRPRADRSHIGHEGLR